MTSAPTSAFFDPLGRGKLLPRDSSLRRRWPGLAAYADRLGRMLLYRYEAVLPDRLCIERQYRAFVGEPLNLDRPRLLSEKIQWLKLHDVTPLHTICADKIRSRDYVRDKVGEEYLIPAFLISNSAQDITPQNIRAERFVAKSNHDWGGVVLCRDRSRFDWAGTRDHLGAQLQKPFWKTFRERAYKDIPPGIIVESLLEPADGGLAGGYKFFCFHGRPTLVQLVDGRDGWPSWTMYDLDWNMLPVWRRGRPRTESPQEKPDTLAAMAEIAEHLSQPFRFCRVDLYEVEGRIYFGEIAFYPEAGYRPFEPLDFDRELGDLLRLD